MKKTQKIAIFLFFTGVFHFGKNSGDLLAQDIHFSQFTQVPLQVNPAQAGTTAWIRGIVIFRNQWNSVVPYTTYGFSFDQKIKKRWKQQQKKKRTLLFKSMTEKGVGWGVAVYNDKAGDGRMGTLQANLSGAYQLQVSPRGMLSAGLQAGLVQRKIDYDDLIWDNQYSPNSPGGFDPGLNPVENFSSNKFVYPDISCGLFYANRKNERYMRGNDQRDIVIGGSIMHINRPSYSFFGNKERLDRKYVIHANSLIGIKNSNFSLTPAMLFAKQGPNREFVLGTMIRYMLKEDSKYTGYIKGATVSLGGYYRSKDAGIIAAALEFSAYSITASYDINVSKFKAASYGRGAFEISFRFLNPSPFLFTKASFG